MAMQLPSSSSALSKDFTYYDVFISFRGTDTRFGFIGHLYKALSDKGIHTFIDDKELKRGDEITPSLLKSIEDSRTAIIVFSKEYASSSFCLDELVHIIHYFKEKGRLVLPVFYGAEPTQVRHQNDSYGEALAKHEERFQNNEKNMERLLKWKKALNQAANLSGHHFNQGNEYERDFIEKIATDISNKINHVPLHVPDYLVGHKYRISNVYSLLDLGSNDGVRLIGILGIGGIGKTTLAQAVYNLIAYQFECKCFLHNVRENSVKHGLAYLQEQLLEKTIGLKIKIADVREGIPIIQQRLSRKKVLLILDDVDKLNQLENLVGEPGWLGHGSRVIITTRDKCLLSSYGIKKIYKAYGLDKEQAIELVRKKAFKSNKIDSSYDHILNRAVEYASGLPLALEVVGCNLFGKSIEECESTLDKYERIPHEDIQKILKVSYNALDEEQQSVFLDIACVFKGCAQEYIQEVLHDHYGYRIESHIGVLVDRSLIKISSYGHYVSLHDLIEDMGKEIVRQESIKESGERSRLWRCDDIVHVLQENTGTSKIEMIYLIYPPTEPVIDINEKAFKKMTNLKTLIIGEGTNFSKGPKYLPSTLRILKWREFPSESLSSCFSSKRKFNNMKVLRLDGSQYLTHISDVSGLTNLEKFSVLNCDSLITIHNSVGYLIKLEILEVLNCRNLESFPPLQLPSLKKLELSKCMSLKNFPELLCKMTNIKKIKLYNTSIRELSFSFQNLNELGVLKIASGKLKILPECLSECHHLKHLGLYECKFLEEIRGIPPNLEILSAIGCESLSLESTRRLTSQQLHDARSTKFCFANGSEGIPDWFEHQIRGNTISFWFKKKIPSITCICLLPGNMEFKEFNISVNHREFIRYGYLLNYHIYKTALPSEPAFLFNLELGHGINESFANEPESYKAFNINEWNHVELKWMLYHENDYCREHITSMEEDFPDYYLEHYSSKGKMGIHVSWEGGDFSDKEGDVVFKDPYINDYLNVSLSQKKRKQNKFLFGLNFLDADFL